MKLIFKIVLLSTVIFGSCSDSKNNADFIEKTRGRYLYNSDEVIEVYFENDDLYMVWRGAENIKPLKVNDSTFYVKEMNEKIQFLENQSDNKYYMVLVPKNDDAVEFKFRKLTDKEIIPSEYLLNDEYEQALKGYMAIKEKDSLDGAVDERTINSWGYRKLREKEYEQAINIFKINMALYPASSNVYDSLGDALLKNGDTLQALDNYKKSLKLDSGNSRAKRIIDQFEKKE